MLKSIPFVQFAQLLLDSKEHAHKGAIILKAILEAQSPRLSEIAQKMPGTPVANYKGLQRFLARTDPKTTLLRLFQTDAPLVLGDPTEMPRPQAWKTPYMGTLIDGQTKGFWLLTLATPFRGRALPFHFVAYSSKTMGAEESSRNLKHLIALATIKELVGEKPLVFDREFSYLELLENFRVEHIHFVIRLRLGSHPPELTTGKNQAIALTIAPGQTEIYRQLYYKGQVPINVIGGWHKGFSEPLWVMTDLKPEQGLQIYFQRMKIDESFRDLKNLLHLDTLMNKKPEQMVALVMLAHSIGVLTGEGVRDAVYGERLEDPTQVLPTERIPNQPQLRQSRKSSGFAHIYGLNSISCPNSCLNFRNIFKKGRGCNRNFCNSNRWMSWRWQRIFCKTLRNTGRRQRTIRWNNSG